MSELFASRQANISMKTPITIKNTGRIASIDPIRKNPPLLMW
jgi:hypothetical protein